MKTIFLILAIIIILIALFFLFKKKKPQIITTTMAPIPPTTSSPPTTAPIVYYKLYSCLDPNTNYETVASLGTFSTGERVEGATKTYYIITDWKDSSYDFREIQVTKTFQMGCE